MPEKMLRDQTVAYGYHEAMCTLKDWFDYNQCSQQGEANRGSVAGPPNSPGLFQIRSGSSVTFQSSFFKGFILLYFRLNSACFLVLRFMLPFNLKPLIEGGNLQVYIYCVSSQKKKASGAPRTHFRACKISTFSGRIPPDPPRTIHIAGPHFLSLPWARPILLAALTIITRL